MSGVLECAMTLPFTLILCTLGQAREHDRTFIFVHRQKNELFVFSTAEPKEHLGRVWRFRLDKDIPAEKNHFIAGAGPGDSLVMRSYLSPNALWLKCGPKVHRIPRDDLFLYSEAWKMLPEALKTKYPGIRLFDWSFQYWPIKPVLARPLVFPKGFGLEGGFGVQDQRFDGFPLDDDRFRVLAPDDKGERIDVWDVKGRWFQDKQEWLFDWDAKPRETIRPGLKEEFYSFKNGDIYYLITQLGKSYFTDKAVDGKRKLQPAPAPEGTITKTVLFSDLEGNKLFLFAFDEVKASVQFCEVREPLRFETLAVKDLSAVTAPEPVRTARQALDLLLRRKMIAAVEAER